MKLVIGGNVLGNRLTNISVDVIFHVRANVLFFWRGGGGC